MELSGLIRNDRSASSGTPAPPSAAEIKLRAAAEQFESLFVQTLMKSMRQTVQQSDLTESGEIDTYREMLDEAMANPKHIRDIGVKWTAKQCEELLNGGVKCLHFYIMNDAGAVTEVIKQLG